MGAMVTVNLARQDQREIEEIKGSREFRAQKETLETEAMLDKMDIKGIKGIKGHKDIKEIKEIKEIEVIWDYLVWKDRRVDKDPLDIRVKRATEVKKAKRVIPAIRGYKDIRENKVLEEIAEEKVTKVKQDIKEKKGGHFSSLQLVYIYL